MHDLIRAKLKLVNQYIIPFTSLKEGEHKFTFDFEKRFFDEHDVLEVAGGKLEANVLLDKKPTLLSLEFAIDGQVEIRCDKCLDYFNFPIRYRSDLVVKFDTDTSAGTDEIWILNPGEHELNLEQYFFECVGLCLPIQRIHPENALGITSCNPEMLKILESYSSVRLTETEPDPRWDKLKNLNDTNNN